MSIKRRSYSASEKAKIALEAIKGELTVAQITAKYGCHSTQISSWKKQLKEGLPDFFKDKRKQDKRENETLTDELYKQIGQLKVELDWLKKKSELFT